jgi:hypothetical protein
MTVQAASGWRIHCGVEVTELSTIPMKHTLSNGREHVGFDVHVTNERADRGRLAKS